MKPGKAKAKRNGPGPLGLLGAGLCLMALLPGARTASAAGKCEGDSARFHIMPKDIGNAGRSAPAPFAFPCDSMVVPAGQTTIIHGSTLAHFGDPSLASKITVKGNLVVEGKPERPAYLCGSISTTEFGPVPGSQAWGGVEVDSGASLRISHARVFNAPTALILFSKDMVLEDCYFRGTSGLVLPDTSLFLDPKGATLDKLDTRNGRPVLSAHKEKENREKGHGKDGSPAIGKRAAWIAAGAVGILAASGAAWLALRDDSKENGSGKPSDQLDADPVLPDVPAQRGP